LELADPGQGQDKNRFNIPQRRTSNANEAIGKALWLQHDHLHGDWRSDDDLLVVYRPRFVSEVPR
jgi:hypothetical protein